MNTVADIALNPDIEHIKECPLCQSDGYQDDCVHALDHLVSKKTFSVTSCRACGLLYTNPRPTENTLPAYYGSDQYISHAGSAVKISDRVYMLVRNIMRNRKIRLLSAYTPAGGRVLDIGCGTGSFLYGAGKAGFEVAGVEPGNTASAICTAKGLEVYGDLESILHTPYKAFNTLSMWHVLEHVSHLRQHLDNCRKLLLPEGYLLIAVPMYKSWDARFYKADWAAWDLPRHLLHFSEETLLKALQQAGFRLVRKKMLPFDAWYISLLSEQRSKRIPSLTGFVRAMLAGTISNLVAITGMRPASGQVFVFQCENTPLA